QGGCPAHLDQARTGWPDCAAGLQQVDRRSAAAQVDKMRVVAVKRDARCKELDAKERDAHTALYAALCKENGEVASSKKVGAATRHSGQSLSSVKTVTEKVASDLGIHRKTVAHRIKNAIKLAARAGYFQTSTSMAPRTGRWRALPGR